MDILFDLDGTLTDPHRGITKCIQYALDQLGQPLPPPTRLTWCIGPPLMESFSRLLQTKDDALVRKAVALYRERFGSVGLLENQVYDGVPEMLTMLRKEGHTLYVATSKPAIYAARIIDHFGLRPYFKGVYGSDLDGMRSDKPRLIAHVLKRESIRTLDAAMVGDRRHDMLGAAANGVYAVGVLWGYGSKEELEAAGAKALIADPHRLVAHFRKRPRPSTKIPQTSATGGLASMDTAAGKRLQRLRTLVHGRTDEERGLG